MSLPNNSALDSELRPAIKPILCYVTDRRGLHGASTKESIDPLLERIEAIAAAGVDWIQLREKDVSGRDAASLTREALRRVSKLASLAQPAPRILVNDRLDVALAEKAGGVHLGENSLPVVEAKRLVLAFQASESLAPDFLVGVSCHSLEAAQSAASAGADYIFFGPIFATPSKAAYGAPQGLLRLAKVCSSLAIPVLAIGGITIANVSSCFSAGASGIAAIRMFQDSADPAEIVRRLRQLRC
ncbi:MAG: thiamine phosphate synthase [Candidatus Acidiferrales bacterium]